MKLLTSALLAATFLATGTAFAETEEEAWERVQDEAARVTDGLPEDDAKGKEMLAERLKAQGKVLGEFLAKFPQSPNRWEARMAALQVANYLDMLEDRQPDLQAQRKEFQSIADDKEAPENIRADAGLVLLQIATAEFEEARSEESARSLSAAIAKFLETHPDDPREPVLRLTEAQTLEAYDQDRARALYEEAAKNEDEQIAQAAKDGLTNLELRSKPLELSFTAVDGRKVDLADLRGKVVLVDFWATWCPPCVEEAPALVEAYGKFKDRGFEIVGISLDKEKAALESFIAENKMTWPQFFDGNGWDNELAKRFKIQSVPNMWLLDREGKLVDPNPRNRLETAIETALSAAP